MQNSAEPLCFHEFFRIFSPKIFLVKLKLFKAKQYKVIVFWRFFSIFFSQM